ncbi:hypothetical protein ABT115_20190 [Streptomyces sp. NPDC001832]|uniref:hypothetical protein n=1 Tax=Streptomyces sp. NPDC001832 TaxID=3154527 RepID=UPI00332F5F60
MVYIPVGATILPAWLICLLATVITMETLVAVSAFNVNPSSDRSRSVIQNYVKINKPARSVVDSWVFDELKCLSDPGKILDCLFWDSPSQ